MLHVTILHSLAVFNKLLIREVITPYDYLATSMSAKNIPPKSYKMADVPKRHSTNYSTWDSEFAGKIVGYISHKQTNKPPAQPSHHTQDNSKPTGVS
jgi:hypothetical protein